MAFLFVNGNRKIARMSNCNSVVQWLLVVPKMCWNWCCDCSVMRQCLWLAPCFCGTGWRWIAYISKIDTTGFGVLRFCFETLRCWGDRECVTDNKPHLTTKKVYFQHTHTAERQASKEGFQSKQRCEMVNAIYEGTSASFRVIDRNFGSYKAASG